MALIKLHARFLQVSVGLIQAFSASVIEQLFKCITKFQKQKTKINSTAQYIFKPVVPFAA